MIKKYLPHCVLLLTALLLAGCATAPKIATPQQIQTLNKQPMQGNTGQYLCPLTSDGVPTEWIDNAVNAAMGASLGATAGAYAGQKLMENIPFIGGFLGSTAGEALGRQAAISAAGGEEFMRTNSDLSFDNIDDMIVYVYGVYGANPNYQELVSSVSEIYPDYNKRMMAALSSASKEYYTMHPETNQ